MNEKDRKNNILFAKYEKLQKETTKDPLDFEFMLNTFKIDYPELEVVKISRNFSIPTHNIVDTTYMVFLQFNDTISADVKKVLKKKVSNKIQYILKENTNTKQDSIPIYIIK